MGRPSSIVLLTGAGISAESGLRTFRGTDGLWENHRVEEVATPEAFAREPALVQRFYNERRRQLREVEPNPAHAALARLDQAWRGDLLLVTQNVDDLHDRAGSRRLVHMHGELRKARCLACRTVHPWEDDLGPSSRCPACGVPCRLRPHIVWFGEVPFHLDAVEEALATCTHFLAIGTSGQVWPAAGMLQHARARGAATHVQALEPPANLDPRDRFHEGRAAVIVPQMLAGLARELGLDDLAFPSPTTPQ